MVLWCAFIQSWSRIKKIKCTQIHLKSPYDHTRTNQLVATLYYVSTQDLTMSTLACQPDVRHQCLVSRSFKATSPIICLPASSDLSNWCHQLPTHKFGSTVLHPHEMPSSIDTRLVRLFSIHTKMSPLTNTIRFNSQEHHNKTIRNCFKICIACFSNGSYHSRSHKLKVPP